ncbi:MAG: acetyl-CoA carboxylase biotin carboxyl carrier protein [Candidatus Acidiferrales bacterium]
MAKKTRPEASSSAPLRGVDLAEVERLLEFMQKHGLEQFEYERGGIHILLKKASVQHTNPFGSLPVTEAFANQPRNAPTSARDLPNAAGAPPAEAEPPADLHVIKSPIVGTFYAAPSPAAGSFVTVGARVEPGQVLCIIEAMKLMNEIESDVAGTVLRMLPENGSPVEYGEPLFDIRLDRKK